MKKRVVSPRRSGCPLNATLEVLGDRWSLLIVRDLMFKGRTTYKDFLAGGEGIATNVLADRLQRLEAEGIIEKGRDAADARRLVYRLTTKGLALAPVLVEMIVWGAGHYQTAAPPATIREMTQHRERFLADIRSRAGAADPTASPSHGRARSGGPCRKNSTRPHKSAAAGRLERPLENCD